MSVVRNVMVYLGLAPDDEYNDYGYGYPEDEYEPEVAPRERESRPRPVAAPAADYDVEHEEGSTVGAVRPLRPADEPAPIRSSNGPAPVRSTEPSTVTVRRATTTRSSEEPAVLKPRVVAPDSFADAKAVGDEFRRGVPVVMNLTGLDRDLSRRLIDFASGLCYGLDGSMEKLAGAAFLLLPDQVEVAEDERRRLVDRGFARS